MLALAVGCGRQPDVHSTRGAAEDGAAGEAGREPPASGEWARISPGGETTCARGTPYSFWARPGSTDRLLVFFQGGGGCWSAATCRPGSDYFKDLTGDFDDPSRERGIFDLANPENPFREYSMVFVPYCTGDVHWGDKVHVYEGRDGSRVRIRHEGFVNATAAMEWTYDHFEDPVVVFVAGCSAGSVGSILFAAYAARHYEEARIAQLGDSEAFVFSRPVDLDAEWGAHAAFPSWIRELERMEPGQFTMARFYSAVARAYPGHAFAQYTTAHDSVQIRYFLAADDAGLADPGGDDAPAADGAPVRWEEALEASLGEIHANAPNFRSYLAPGHTRTASCRTRASTPSK